MKRYRLDPKKPRRLTPEEARRLARSRIDYSDIPPLGDEFFARAKKPMLHQIIEAIPHPDHTVTITWSGCARATISFAPFWKKAALFEALKDPDYRSRREVSWRP